MRVLKFGLGLVLELFGALALALQAGLLLTQPLLRLAPQHFLARRGQIVGRQVLDISVAASDCGLDEPVAVLLPARLLHIAAAVPAILVGLTCFSTLRAAALGVPKLVRQALLDVLGAVLGRLGNQVGGFGFPAPCGRKFDAAEDPNLVTGRRGRQPGFLGLGLGFVHGPMGACALFRDEVGRIPTCRIRKRRLSQHSIDALPGRAQGGLDPLAALRARMTGFGASLGPRFGACEPVRQVVDHGD